MDLCIRPKFYRYLKRPTLLFRHVLTFQRCCTTLRLPPCLLALLDVSVISS